LTNKAVIVVSLSWFGQVGPVASDAYATARQWRNRKPVGATDSRRIVAVGLAKNKYRHDLRIAPVQGSPADADSECTLMRQRLARLT
jgi:hypothetical protein